MGQLSTILLWIVSIEHIHVFLYVMFLIAILVSDKSPESMVSWIFTITIFPFFGFFLYLIFGVNWRKNRITTIKDKELGKKKRVKKFHEIRCLRFFSF